MALKIDTSDLQASVGGDCGTSDWLEIDQKRINDFADVTLDHQFIHVDPERAKESPLRWHDRPWLSNLIVASLFYAVRWRRCRCAQSNDGCQLRFR